MMKHIIFTGALLLASAVTGVAMATCGSPATQVTGTALTTLLNGNTICVGSAGNWESQELHSGGALIDYKMGPAAPGNVDPTETVGTYAIDEPNSKVTYNYGSSGPYTYSVWDNGSNSYSFCGGNPAEIFATKKSGSGACP